MPRLIAVVLLTAGVIEGFMYVVSLIQPYWLINKMTGYDSESRLLALFNEEFSATYGLLATLSLGLSGVIFALNQSKQVKPTN